MGQPETQPEAQLELRLGSAPLAEAGNFNASSNQGGTDFATFAAGCFWGVELAFQRVPGVVRVSELPLTEAARQWR